MNQQSDRIFPVLLTGQIALATLAILSTLWTFFEDLAVNGDYS